MDSSEDVRPPHSGNAVTLRVSGEVDLMTSRNLRQRLHDAAAGSAELVVDLSAVTFMDCAGMRPLLEARRSLGPRLGLRGIPESLARIIRVCDLGSSFTILDAAGTPADDSLPDASAEGDEMGNRREARANDLREAIAHAPVVEQAKGLVMGTHNCSAESAWQLMLDVCRVHRVRVDDLAALLVDDASGTFGEVVDPALLDALRAVLPPAQDVRAPAR
jgi:anti-anti-sigma factor